MKRALTAIAVVAASIAIALASMATTVNAAPSSSPFACAGHSMPMMDAKRSVLVKLERYVNGKPMYDEGLAVWWWRGNWHREVGMAHPGCWTALSIRPSTLRYHDGTHPSLLCISVHNGNKAYSDNPKEIPACPWPKVIRYMGTTWTTIVFRVVTPPNGG